MLFRLITHILYYITGGLSTILSERFVKKIFTQFSHWAESARARICVHFVKIRRNLFHIMHDKKRSRSPALCGGIKSEWWKLLSPYHRQAFQTYPQAVYGVDLPPTADAGFLPFLKMNLLPKQSTRSPLPRSQVGASLMTFPLVCGLLGLFSASRKGSAVYTIGKLCGGWRLVP